MTHGGSDDGAGNTVEGASDQDSLLDPVDRLSEIIFGLLMALTFTGTMSVALGSGGTVNGILMAAIGCNIAWGLVDGVMYLLHTATARRRTDGILGDLRGSDPAGWPGIVRGLLDDDMARHMSDDELRHLAGLAVRMPQRPRKAVLRGEDFRAAAAIFLLVVVSTFPPILPFLLTENVPVAMRVSNLIAVAMLFGIGWKLDFYIEHGSTMMRIAVPLIGVALVITTIALGG